MAMAGLCCDKGVAKKEKEGCGQLGKKTTFHVLDCDGTDLTKITLNL